MKEREFTSRLKEITKEIQELHYYESLKLMSYIYVKVYRKGKCEYFYLIPLKCQIGLKRSMSCDEFILKQYTLFTELKNLYKEYFVKDKLIKIVIGGKYLMDDSIDLLFSQRY